MYGEKIKAKRRELHLSQEDLANKIFVTRQAISKWENDKATPTMTNLRELSEVFDVDMAYFIGEVEKTIDDKKINETKEVDGKKLVLEGIGNIFIYACLCLIGIFFYAVYYYGIMDRLLGLNPKDMPYLILTIYMIIAVIAFPQAYKDLAYKLDGLEYNLFSKVVLPIVYIFAPLIVFYYIIKKS
ncbi:MAG: helix-turn-helix transcriptional regulator [Peptoniphilus harei]|nr:helix-turn-helix transcriptional regulator [Peptoniphilus harei]